MTQGSSNQGEAQGLGSHSLPAHWGGNVPSGHLEGSCHSGAWSGPGGAEPGDQQREKVRLSDTL